MKKLSFLLAVLLVITCIPMAAMTTISAAGENFQVGDESFATYNEAWVKAGTAGNPNEIVILNDVTIGAANEWSGKKDGKDWYPEQPVIIDGNNNNTKN